MPRAGQRLKTYLDKGTPCNVPYTTRLRRERRTGGERRLAQSSGTSVDFRGNEQNEPVERPRSSTAGGSAQPTSEAAVETLEVHEHYSSSSECAAQNTLRAVYSAHDCSSTESPSQSTSQVTDIQSGTHNVETLNGEPLNTEPASPEDPHVDSCDDVFYYDVGSEADTSSGRNGTLLREEVELLSGSLSEFQATTLPHSPTTVAEAVTMLMTFVVSHGLSWTALDDLLALTNALFGPTASVLPRTKYLFRKLWAAKTTALAKTFYYCHFCGAEVEFTDGDRMCSCQSVDCDTTHTVSKLRTNGNFFTILDLRSQILHLIALNADELYQNLLHIQAEGERGTDVITDITNAMHSRQLRDTGKLKWTDLTITFNTDGTPVFKSSKSAIWPIQFTLNELPPQLRLRKCVTAGLWFGPNRPNMTLFLSKFVQELEDLSIRWSCGDQTVVSSVYATCCSVDSPARAAVRNHVTFSGYFGCPWCFARGTHDSGKLCYENTEVDEERTAQQVKSDMNLALECSCIVNGIKGPSPVMNLKNFDLVWSFSVDYMHAVLLGVTRQVTECLLDSCNSGERYYIGSPSSINAIDRRLLSIRPPHNFTRLPRSVRERCFWKASEWRLWLLLYCLPCTLNVLPHLYWCHIRSLVEAVFILLSEELAEPLLRRADFLLQKFVRNVGAYYGTHMMTFNVHLLLHLTKAARQQGPLWANSAFVFESGNGKLVKSIQAAKGAPLQVIERVVMEEEVALLLKAVPMSSTVKTICSRMTTSQHIQNAVEVDGA